MDIVNHNLKNIITERQFRSVLKIGFAKFEVLEKNLNTCGIG
jgi:hypothetical protein